MLATIDVGSNTVRLLLGEIIAGRVEPFLYARKITRLKGGQAGDGLLAVAAMDRTLLALNEFADLLHIHSPVAVRAVGTAALRQAKNTDEFLRRIFAETGVNIEVISGDEEARLSALGVSNVLSPFPEYCLIVDVGGGSTEFVLLKQGRVVFEQSIPLGVVALAEARQEAGASPVIAQQVAEILELCAKKTSVSASRWSLIGTAGTATTLAAISLQMTDYDWRQVNNYRLDTAELVKIHDRLQGLPLSKREALPGMEAGRGDLILHGIAIYLAVLHAIAADHMTISDFGLLEGVLVDLARREASS